MRGSLLIHRGIVWAAAALAVFIATTAGLIAAVDAGYIRWPLIHLFSARVGRPIQVDGTLEAHLFSLNPRVTAERVSIGNPPWMPAGRMAEIGKLSLMLKLPGFHHSLGVVRLEMEAATLNLVRDSSGNANWQLTEPGKSDIRVLPIVRSMSILNAHVVLDDALHHLQFEGTVSARQVDEAQGPQALQIAGTGQLNGRAASFEIISDPLATASHRTPYGFSFTEQSSGSRLTGHGSLPRPFNFDELETTFDAAGADLKDLYFLVGVTLINTGSYHLSGRITRRGTLSTYSDLVVTSGESDMHGTVSIDSSATRPKLDVVLESRLLRLSDLGARNVGRDSEAAKGAPLLLSNAMLSPSALRHDDAAISFHARRVDVGRLTLSALAAKATINRGVLTVAPLSADVLGGKLTLRLKLDASTDSPAANVDLKITDLQLGQFPFKGAGQPPIEGLLQAQVAVTGRGSSLHQVAASADGMVTAQLPHGLMRDSLAQSTGIDLYALGLLLTKSKKETTVRCAVASFKAHQGTLTAQTLIVDTDPVLISGGGQIHLDTEALELVLHGQPRNFGVLRLRSPVLVQGTLAHPTFGLQAHSAKLALVDPGLAQDKDAGCTAK